MTLFDIVDKFVLQTAMNRRKKTLNTSESNKTFFFIYLKMMYALLDMVIRIFLCIQSSNWLL